jgi:hypothetical protein
MADRKNDVLLSIIQNELSSMGAGYQPNISANPSYSENRPDRWPEDEGALPTGRITPQRPPRPEPTPEAVNQWTQDMGSLLGPHRSLSGRPAPERAPRPDKIAEFQPVYTDEQAFNPDANPAANPMRAIFGAAAIDAIPSRTPKPSPDAPNTALAASPEGYSGAGLLPQNPDIMFAGAEGGVAPPMPTPADTARAGLAAAAAGQPAPVNPMAPEVFDPETGTRPEEARKMGLLERMFGEKGSDQYKNAGKALMMAGAAIMSTSGSLGEAVANGIQAGLMTYDDAMQALKDEEKEARQMGMTEEAHELNMELKRLQLSRAKQGPVKPEPKLTPVQQAMITSDQLISQFKIDPDTAMLAAVAGAYKLSPTLLRPREPDLLASLNE